MKRRLWYFLEDSFMRFFRFFRWIIPRAWIAPLGRLAGALLLNLVGPYKRRVLAQLREAFPEKPEAEIRRIFQKAVRNGGEVLFEQLMVSEEMMKREMEKVVSFENLDRGAREVYGRGKGVLVVGTHMSNWEKFMGIGSYRMWDVLGCGVNVVMNRMPTPYLDSLVTVLRNRILKLQFIYTKRSRYYINRILDQKGIVVFASDVDYRYRGLFVPFFNRKISMGRGPAHYAVTRDVPLCFMMLNKDEAGKLHVHFEEVAVDRTGETEQDVYNLTAAMAARIEYWVSQYPEQWFGWLQQPWKTRPVEELEACLKDDPGNLAAMEQMGLYFLAGDRREEAKEILGRALEIDPDRFLPHSELGRLLLEEGTVEDGMFHLFRALELRPRDVKTLKRMGHFLMERELYKVALNYFRRARKVRFDDPEAYWGIGRCLDAQGHRKKALAVYRKGLRRNDDFAPLHLALAEIYASRPEKKDVLDRHLDVLETLRVEIPPELVRERSGGG